MVDVNKKELGERIKKIRLELGDTTEVFGKRFDPQANRSLVSAWENGRYIPNPERLKSLAELGGISVNELLYGDLRNFTSHYFDERIAEQKEKFENSFFGSMLNDPEYTKSVKNDFLYKIQFYDLSHSDTEALNKLIDESINAVMRGEEYTNQGAFALAKNRLRDTTHQLEEFFHEVVREDGKNRITSKIKDGLDPVILERLNSIFKRAENEVSSAKDTYFNNNQ